MRWKKAIEFLPDSGKEVFMKIEGARSIGRYSEHHDLFINESGDFFPADQIEWLDENEQDEGWVSVVDNNFPFDVSIILEHGHGYDAIRLDREGWKFWYTGELVPETIISNIIKSAKRYIIGSGNSSLK